MPSEAEKVVVERKLKEPPRGQRMKTGFLMSSMAAKNFEMATSFSDVTLLPPPFSTRCLNYGKFNYTHEYCVHSCTNITRNEKHCAERVCMPQCHSIIWFSVSATSSSETALNFPEYACVIKLVPSIDGVDFVSRDPFNIIILDWDLCIHLHD